MSSVIFERLFSFFASIPFFPSSSIINTGVKKIIITENGAAFNDIPHHDRVHDQYRIDYLQQHISELKRAKDEGINIKGYFVWSFIDNFEWSEGYHPRFGIVYVDFKTQQRIVKDSGYWYQKFLRE